MVLEIAKARRDAAGLAAALPHMLSVHDYAKDEQYTSYWQGYGVSPLDLWPNELLVDSQEDRPWIADDVLASVSISHNLPGIHTHMGCKLAGMDMHAAKMNSECACLKGCLSVRACVAGIPLPAASLWLLRSRQAIDRRHNT